MVNRDAATTARSAGTGDEQPTIFEFTLNMKTAKTLGITFTPSILVRATKVIE